MSESKSIIFGAAFAAALVANADSLYWNGGNDGTWNAGNSNWTNASGTATAWVDGSDAVFDASVDMGIPVKGPVHADNILFVNGTKAVTLGDAGTLSWQGWAQSSGGNVSFACPLADNGNGLHFEVRGHTYLKRANTHTGGTFIRNTSSGTAMRAFAINGASKGADNPDGNDLALGPVPDTVQTNLTVMGGYVALFVDNSFTNTIHRNRTILVKSGNTFYVSPSGELRIMGGIVGENKPGTDHPTETRLYFHNQWGGRTILGGTNKIGRILVTGNAAIAGGKTTYISSGQSTGENAGLWIKGNGSAYGNTKGYLLVSGGILENLQSGYRSQTSEYGHLDIAGGTVAIQNADTSEFLNALSTPGKVTIRDGGLMACRKFRISQVGATSTTTGGEVFLEEGGTLRAKWLWVDFGNKRKGKVHFNGGALQSIAGNNDVSITLSPTTNMWEGTDFVVESGGAVFDTANGQNLWFGRPLLSGLAGGETDGGLTCKVGGGRAVVLHDCFADSTYTGPTRVERIGSSGTGSLQCRVANALPATTTLQIGPGCQAGFNLWKGAAGSAEREAGDLALTTARLEGAGYLFYNSRLNVTEAIAPVFDGAYGTLSFEKPFASNCDLEITGDANGCGRVEFKRAGQSLAGLSLKVDTTGLSNEKGAKFYKIVDAPNGYTGTFASTNLPENWRVVYESNAVYLAPVNAFVMVVR